MASLLDGLDIVLVKTRFPENIGMAARACVNMGCSSLSLVDPERWDKEKARPLATPKGQDLLDDVKVYADLPEAVAPVTLVVGTTARVGGWRQSLLSPGRAAADVAEALAHGERVALVFGPEDRGLNNEEITHCHKLVTIPTDPAASSLNLAQADNPDYFIMPWRRLFSRAGLRRHEYDALMGLCRQVRHKLG